MSMLDAMSTPILKVPNFNANPVLTGNVNLDTTHPDVRNLDATNRDVSTLDANRPDALADTSMPSSKSASTVDASKAPCKDKPVDEI